ncbi:MAG: preprotein translocase subunit SecE [Chloroherpetonaceae bacterium]|nr:preprotein translocase subunit SecE [Chloroherpetonaceae bacterium]MCS7210429.1 preprotein translocase subunit SecE [Chloroherpetonaceae bacterium]MDW8019296.1 preprotein translocase subunit SecE [Chloroherpetonaceae bacterium]
MSEKKLSLTARIVNYYQEVVSEMKKVTWPSQEEVKESTLVVLTVCGILVLGTFIVDETLSFLIRKLVSLL